jgi:hypothetical protein
VIEFSCPHCQKVLKTSDEKAGVQAKCPGCGEVVSVPLASAEPVGDIVAFDAGAAESPVGAEEAPGEMQTCPMCGQQIKAAAVKCRYCGEDLRPAGDTGQRGQINPTIIDAGTVLNRTWEIYKPQMGITIGAFAITWFLGQLAGAPAQILNFLMSSGVIDQEFAPLLAVGFVVLAFAANAVSLYLNIGQSILMLKVARGDTVEITDVFRGGRYFWRTLGAAILFGLMVTFGTIACIIPGIILALMFAPFMYVLIDQNCGVMDSLSIAKSVTKNNLMTNFVLGLAAFGLVLGGLLAFCVGIFLVIPYVMLMQAVVYLMMSGQPLARPTT